MQFSEPKVQITIHECTFICIYIFFKKMIENLYYRGDDLAMNLVACTHTLGSSGHSQCCTRPR